MDHYQSIIETQRILTRLRLEHWLHYEVFRPGWWFLLGLTIISLSVWWKLVKKEMLQEVVIFGLLIAGVSTLLDVLGSELLLWVYPLTVVPVIPRLFVADVGLIPVAFMLIYQWFTNWKPFFTAMLVFSFMASFLLESLFEWLNIYQVIVWKHVYSFPIYIILGVSLKWLTQKIVSASRAGMS